MNFQLSKTLWGLKKATTKVLKIYNFSSYLLRLAPNNVQNAKRWKSKMQISKINSHIKVGTYIFYVQSVVRTPKLLSV